MRPGIIFLVLALVVGAFIAYSMISGNKLPLFATGWNPSTNLPSILPQVTLVGTDILSSPQGAATTSINNAPPARPGVAWFPSQSANGGSSGR